MTFLPIMLFSTVPCVPTNVSVVTDCANDTAVVSWSASRGAVWYAVTANNSHSNVSCQTSDLSCSLDNLTCGSRYTVQVVAMDDNCSSVPSQAKMFNSGETENTNKYTLNTQLQLYTFKLKVSPYSQPPARLRMCLPRSVVPQTT